MEPLTTDTFPRQLARTQRFTLGEPRNVIVSADGERVIFLRSEHGSDSVNSLWVLNVDTGSEKCVADPRLLLADEFNKQLDGTSSNGQESSAERSRRERVRESANGVVGFSCDSQSRRAVFTIGGRLFMADLQLFTSHQILITAAQETGTEIDPGDKAGDKAIFDPRLSPDGTLVGYVRSGSMCVCTLDGRETVIAHEPNTQVSWGQAEFIAAEEMGRQRGYWWSPDSSMIAACRVDTSEVATAWIGDASNPMAIPREVRYPFAGTANARVELHIFDLAAKSLHVEWNHAEFPYLNSVHWNKSGLLLATQSRDQCRVQMHSVNPATGSLTLRHEESDDIWVELVAGVPLLLEGNRVLHCGERNNARALCIDGLAITDSTIQVRSVIYESGESALVTFNPIDDPTVLHLAQIDLDSNTIEILSDQAAVHGGSIGGDTVVIRRANMVDRCAKTFVRNGPTLLTHAESPLVQPNVAMHRIGPNQIAVAVVLPNERTAKPLPVLFDPYGGPHAQRVVSSRNAYLTSQWFADKGFCVVIADGRGTPGRGSMWERSVSGDLATGILADQLAVLNELPQLVDNLDLTKVGIRGWSFGGYLAALAVLRQPEHFHAAVAGAPVADWRLYDTHYTERYLGHPDQNSDAYDESSLMRSAGLLRRPLLLIHGLADDNVFAAHSLRLSSALLAHGREHEVLPLSGVTHMASQEVVAENLLLHQLAFLKRALAI